MYYLRKIIMLVSALLVLGNAEGGISQDSVSPLYINYPGREMLCDVPWVINKDEPIPFFFIIKDCNQGG